MGDQQAADEIDDAHRGAMDQRSVIGRLEQETVPAAERIRDEQPPRRFRTVDEGHQLHQQTDDYGQPDAGGAAARGDRQQDSQRRESKGRRQHGCPCEHDPRQCLSGLQQEARQVDERRIADDQHARRDAARGEQRDRQQRECDGGERLAREDLGAAPRPREHGRPGAVAILCREQIAADDAGQHRERPQPRESKHHQRHREAGLVDGAAEQRIGRQAALDAHRDGEGERGDDADRQQHLRLDLRRQLRALDADHREHAADAHARLRDGSPSTAAAAADATGAMPWRSPVSSRNSDSSDRVRRSSERSAIPACPSAIVYASSASVSPATSRPPSPAAERRTLRPRRPEPRVVGGMVVARVQKVKRRRRAQPQFFDAAGIHHVAVIDHRQRITQLFDLRHVVAAQHHGRSLFGQTFDEHADVARGGWIERAGRLVEQQHLRRSQQRRRQAKPLAHARRVSRDGDVGTRAQADLLERPFDACPTVRRRAIVETGEE